jgi:hypothetical protein
MVREVARQGRHIKPVGNGLMATSGSSFRDLGAASVAGALALT